MMLQIDFETLRWFKAIDGTTRPLIRLDDGHITPPVDKALCLMSRYFFWQCNNCLFEVIPESKADLEWYGLCDGMYYKIRRLNSVRLQLILANISDWERYDHRKRQWVRCKVPAEVARTIMSLRGHWPFPQLSDLIGAKALDMTKPGRLGKRRRA
jgi:hypothetical protein